LVEPGHEGADGGPKPDADAVTEHRVASRALGQRRTLGVPLGPRRLVVPGILRVWPEVDDPAHEGGGGDHDRRAERGEVSGAEEHEDNGKADDRAQHPLGRDPSPGVMPGGDPAQSRYEQGRQDAEAGDGDQSDEDRVARQEWSQQRHGARTRKAGEGQHEVTAQQQSRQSRGAPRDEVGEGVRDPEGEDHRHEHERGSGRGELAAATDSESKGEQWLRREGQQRRNELADGVDGDAAADGGHPTILPPAPAAPAHRSGRQQADNSAGC